LCAVAQYLADLGQRLHERVCCVVRGQGQQHEGAGRRKRFPLLV
jgi:hypothetical protein